MVDQGDLEGILAGPIAVLAPFDRAARIVVCCSFHRQDRTAALLAQQCAFLGSACPGADPLLGHPNVDAFLPHQLVHPARGEIQLTQADQVPGQEVLHDGQRLAVRVPQAAKV